VDGCTLDVITSFLYCFSGEEVLIGEPEGEFCMNQFDTSSEVVLLAAGTGKY